MKSKNLCNRFLRFELMPARKRRNESLVQQINTRHTSTFH